MRGIEGLAELCVECRVQASSGCIAAATQCAALVQACRGRQGRLQLGSACLGQRPGVGRSRRANLFATNVNGKLDQFLPDPGHL